jgi:hypothetical protein
VGRHRGGGLVALVALVAPSLAGCSACHTDYVLDWKCGGTIKAPASLLLPDALAPDCGGADAAYFVNDGCFPRIGRVGLCTDVSLGNGGSAYLATPAAFSLAIKIKLPAASAPMLSVTLPDPSVTVVATYLSSTSDPSVPFNAVSGALTLKITANDLTSTFSLRLMDAAGQEIDIENGSYTVHGHDQDICYTD